MEKLACILATFLVLVSVWNLGSTETLFEKVIEYSKNELGKTCDANEISAQSCDHAIENNMAEPTTVCLVTKSDQEEYKYVVCDKGIWKSLGTTTYERHRHREKRLFGFIAAVFTVVSVVSTVCMIFCESSSGGGGGTVEQNSPPVVTCPQIQTEFVCPPRETGVIVSWSDATAEDEEDKKAGKETAVKQTHGRPSGSKFYQRDTVIYRAEDSHGVSATCAFTFSVTVITCFSLDWPRHGRKSCDISGDILGTVCTFTCDVGYELQGNNASVCQSDKTYSNQPPTCVPTTCGQPQSPENGQVICSDSSHSYNSICFPTCNPGYRLDRYMMIQCKADRTWSSTLPGCTDSEPPVKQFCPSTINAYSDRGTMTATVTWDDPTFTDNAGSVIVTQTVGPPSGSVFNVGGTEIRYRARDAQGNLSPECTFFIIVTTLTCQQNLQDGKLRYNCPNNNFNYGTTCGLSCDGNYPLVGNSTITCERNETVDSAKPFWSWGTGIEPYCQEITCPSIDPPQNGGLTCDTATSNKFCVMMCNAQFDFPIGTTVGEMYVCSNSGTWFPALPVPGCTAVRVPVFSVLPGELYYYSGNCDDVTTQNAIKQNFIQIFQSDKLSKFCPTSGCSVTSVEVTCGPIAGRRKKSVHGGIDITYVDKIQVPAIIENRVERSAQTSHEIKLSYALKMEFESNVTDYFYIHNSMKEFNNATIKQAIILGELNIGNMSVSRSTTGWTDFQCAEGQIFRFQTFSCASCSTGSYFNNTVKDCVKCPVGTYQDEDGSLECKQCPPGTSTIEEGTRNSSLCLDICTEGSFSKTGLSPCFKCLQGQYQDYNQSTSCENCQNMHTTLTTGSANASECTEYDILLKNASVDLGTLSPSFTVAFWVLKRNIYEAQSLDLQSDLQNVFQFVIGNQSSFVINGITTDVSHIVKQTRWIHVVIQLNTVTGSLSLFSNGQNTFSNTIASLIGVNHMLLQVPDFLISGYKVYPTLLSGADILSLSKTCSSNLNSINSSQTLDDLKKIPGAKMVIPSTCNANNGCDDNPCNGHSCLEVLNGFECRCNNGYSGATCNVPPDYCVNNNCSNGATCVGINGTYSCLCKTGYKGTFCDTAVVNGNWNSWQHWSECSQTCGGGIKSRNRSCDDPPPEDGGSYCIGYGSEEQSCNTEACPECPSFLQMLKYGNMLNCNKVNGYDICNVTCRSGLVFPNENFHVYHCGKNTSYEWQQTPPSCMDPNSPAYIAIQGSSTIGSFPCSGKDEAESSYQNNMNQLWCRQHGACDLEMSIDGCNNNGRRKRSTMSSINIYVTLSMQLENEPLDLVAFFENGTVSPALSSFINAYDNLETTAQQMNNLSSTIFAVNISGVTYNINSTINFQPKITCAIGTVFHEGVCAQCPYGTKYLNGICVYCDQGSYQNLTGQTVCTACPYGYTTQFKGSTSIFDCRVQESTTSISPTIGKDSGNQNKDKTTKIEIIIGVVVSSVLCIVAVIIGLVIRKKILRTRLPEKFPSVLSVRKIFPDVCDSKIPFASQEKEKTDCMGSKQNISSGLRNNWFQNEDFNLPLQHKLPPVQHALGPLHQKLPPIQGKK